MERQQKTIARVLFRNKIYESDGQKFEDLFTAIMNYAYEDFQAIKPWGNIGDRKNDGFIPSKGIFFQVYAPENLEQKYPNAIKKLKTDFKGLQNQWSNIKEFYFVVNDKFGGIHADLISEINKIVKEYNLEKGGVKTAKDLENLLFEMEDDKIEKVVGFLPNTDNTGNLDYSPLSEVITHIMELPLNYKETTNYIAPDWNEKIKFNGLSKATETYLSEAYIHVRSLEQYLDRMGNFLGDELRDQLNRIYSIEKQKKQEDNLFWEICFKIMPKRIQMYQQPALVIMAKYFESCDIFEEPK